MSHFFLSDTHDDKCACRDCRRIPSSYAGKLAAICRFVSTKAKEIVTDCLSNNHITYMPGEVGSGDERLNYLVTMLPSGDWMLRASLSPLPVPLLADSGDSLRPCPFCGGAVNLYEWCENATKWKMETEFEIECQTIGCLLGLSTIRSMTDIGETKEVFVRRWNTRAEGGEK